MADARSNDQPCTDIVNLCDPANTSLCWWDFYPMPARSPTSPRGIAVTAGGLTLEAFCNQACADAWARYEAPVGASCDAFRFEATSAGKPGSAAPPREASKKFGGSLMADPFRATASKPVRGVQTYSLGPSCSPMLKMSFYRGEAREPFSVCDPARAKICWWDANHCGTSVVRAAVFFNPAKVMFKKTRYRFCESVPNDYEGRSRDENFVEYGAFCSVECRKAWTLHTFARDPRLVASTLQLDEARDFLADRPPTACRPPREALQCFGGQLTLKQFRMPEMARSYESSVEPVELPGRRLGYKVTMTFAG